MKILLLGGSGYVGGALARELDSRGIAYEAPTHGEIDARSRDAIRAVVAAVQPTHAINAIGYTGRPNVDSTETEKLRCLEANTLVPGILREIFEPLGIRWGHVSSGCIYDGRRPDGSAWTENDPPNFAFGGAGAGWYSRTKAMAETLLEGAAGCLVWRMRIPFDAFDSPRNYLTKLMHYSKLLDVENSITHLGDFARAALGTLTGSAEAGIYNITNPGTIRTRDVAEAIARAGLCKKDFEYFADEAEFLSAPGRVRRASCVLDSGKLERAGYGLRPVADAVRDSLARWQWAKEGAS
jgi:dTDP-4-dehydrorhamnose reductase